MQKRKSKYNNKKVSVDGIVFDSIAESIRYVFLKELETNGKIINLELQPLYPLLDAQTCDIIEVKYIRGLPFKYKKTSKIRAISYKADFKYTLPSGLIVIEDVKGYLTDIYKLKKKLFLKKYLNNTNMFIEVKVHQNKEVVFSTISYTI